MYIAGSVKKKCIMYRSVNDTGIQMNNKLKKKTTQRMSYPCTFIRLILRC